MSIISFKRWFRRVLFDISPRLNVWYGISAHKDYYKHCFDFKHPVTMDEKINVLKLERYNTDPIYTQCADKYAVREYVKKMGCEEILNELYYVWDDVEDIDWDVLPNQFVIKWNFGCGQNLIVKDKSILNIEDAKSKLRSWRSMHNTQYKTYAELQYKNIVPKLICEKLIETEDGNLPVDYKLYCFNGKPYTLMLCFGRGDVGGTKYFFVNRDWELMRINNAGKAAPDGFTLPRPKGADQLFDYAAKLVKPFCFVRSDFYLENGKVTFGELTFTPEGGIDYNFLYETNKMFGDMIDMNYKG